MSIIHGVFVGVGSEKGVFKFLGFLFRILFEKIENIGYFNF